ncbi:B3 domain-containing protein Os11g0197600-like [Solanum dulcamara]|uniref:B3 domain-containing protein Os11g0197600-like n=1 Tax=Solanum dulcamara TaxID=45834 RepID=UPI002485B4EA|nr:B3 domain-containing protein Os11g0197600-like [Solanum dulcamara]
MRNSGATRDDSLCFYKIVLDRQMEELRIPSEFVKHITEEGTGKALLKSRCGKCWSMKLREDENGMFFRGGWKKFVMEQHFEQGEFLLFHYDGKKTFNVRVFNKNGLEK